MTPSTDWWIGGFRLICNILQLYGGIFGIARGLHSFTYQQPTFWRLSVCCFYYLTKLIPANKEIQLLCSVSLESFYFYFGSALSFTSCTSLTTQVPPSAHYYFFFQLFLDDSTWFNSLIPTIHFCHLTGYHVFFWSYMIDLCFLISLADCFALPSSNLIFLSNNIPSSLNWFWVNTCEFPFLNTFLLLKLPGLRLIILLVL